MKKSDEASTSEHNAIERKKSNLAFAFFCMEQDRARDMDGLYAFCRLMDDIADDESAPIEEKITSLKWWKEEIAAIYDESTTRDFCPLGAEMRDIAKRRNIPQKHLQDIIDGVMRDTDPRPFETFEDIRQYCYGVAAAVGLASIYVFGFKNPRTELFAEALGYALQFTNILRDVVDDWRSHKRVYIPAKELKAFGVEKEWLGNPYDKPECARLFNFLYFRAKHFFNKSRRLLAEEDTRNMAPALIMQAIYEEILERLRERNFKIPEKPLKISKAKKIMLALGAIRRSKRAKKEKRFSSYGKVTIAGGGIAGMCAATNLALEGFDVELFEATAHLGGRSSSIEWKTAPLDNGTHAAMGCYKNFFDTLKILRPDIGDCFKRVNAMDFAYPDGERISAKFPSANANIFAKASAFFAYKKLKGFATKENILLLLKIKFWLNAKPKNDETAKAYLARMGIKDTESFWSPFCISALNTTLERAGAKQTISALRKSILSAGDSGILYLPQKPIAESFGEYLPIYLEGIGSKFYLNERVTEIEMSDGKVCGVKTNKRDFIECDHFVSALPINALKTLLPENSPLRERISSIETTDILNIYFTTPTRLMSEDYMCLVNSPLHWIFDHSHKMSDKSGFLYGVTISATDAPATKEYARQLLESELKKFFPNIEILDVLPAQFRAATISADCKSDAARVSNAQLHNRTLDIGLAESRHAQSPARAQNFHVCGDWVNTDLPCTMESAAKSARDLHL